MIVLLIILIVLIVIGVIGRIVLYDGPYIKIHPKNINKEVTE